MKAEDRRALIIDAAMAVFGDTGYVGTTTDQIAREAGVSQPYVVRMFGTKEKLFLAVLDRALTRLLESFREVLADDAGGGERDELHRRFGTAYIDLLRERGLLASLMHAFLLGTDPIIGKAARCGFLDVYRFLRTEADFTAEEVSEFLAGGMLINTMLGTRMADDYDSDPLVRELLDTALPTKVEHLIEAGRA